MAEFILGRTGHRDHICFCLCIVGAEMRPWGFSLTHASWSQMEACASPSHTGPSLLSVASSVGCSLERPPATLKSLCSSSCGPVCHTVVLPSLLMSLHLNIPEPCNGALEKIGPQVHAERVHLVIQIRV